VWVSGAEGDSARMKAAKCRSVRRQEAEGVLARRDSTRMGAADCGRVRRQEAEADLVIPVV
jgi:hypothetical protein